MQTTTIYSIMGIKTPSWPVPLGHKPIDLGLQRVREAAMRLGINEAALPPIIHVAGTNGKGSTIAFLRSLLEAAGKKVHVYTSPHLVYFNERIVTASRMISDIALEDILARTKAACDDLNMTFFEGTTIAALLAFKETNADYVLLETGLGGRLDATNIFKQPAVSVITPIALDHQGYLGEDIAAIAPEKGGIVKEAVPVVLAKQAYAEAAESIETIAAEKNAPLHKVREPVGSEVPLGLHGAHQRHNAATALQVLDVLGVALTKQQQADGLKHAYWPARMQPLEQGNIASALGADTRIWLDGGHNMHAARMMAETMQSWQAPVHMVLALRKDKQAAEVLQCLLPHVSHAFAAPITDDPDAYAPEELAAIAEDLGYEMQPVHSIDQVIDALQQLPTANVLFCGSLYFAGQVIEWDDAAC